MRNTQSSAATHNDVEFFQAPGASTTTCPLLSTRQCMLCWRLAAFRKTSQHSNDSHDEVPAVWPQVASQQARAHGVNICPESVQVCLAEVPVWRDTAANAWLDQVQH